MQPTAPPGGFQEGGWYGGQQYHNGGFGAVGVINNPNQQGYGQAVSQEVNRQSSVAQGKAPDAIQNYVNSGGGTNPANNPQPANGGGGGQPGGTSSLGFNPVNGNQPLVPNIQSVYANAYTNNPGVQTATKNIADLNNQISARQQALDAASKEINDNPFYAEATRTGKLAKLQSDANNDMNTLSNQLKTNQETLTSSQAEAERQVNLSTGQYNLNNAAYQQNLQQFNSLLSAGAFNNASSSDLAQISASTGISPSMLASIQQVQKQKDTPVQIIPSTDSSGNVTITAVDKSTGQVIHQEGLGDIGKGAKGAKGASNVTDQTKQIALDRKQAPSVLTQALKQNKMTLGTAMSFFQQYGMTPQQIYNQYKVNGQYNPNSQQVKADQKKYGVK